MPECDHALFSFKSYSALFLLFLAHGLILEVGGYLCLLINIFCSFLLRVLLRFFFICSIFLSPHGVRILAFVFGCTLGNDGSVDMRDEVCRNPTQMLDN